MPRNMSFALTTAQFLDHTKTVTRRAGWEHLKLGDVVCGVKKAMGLRPGEQIERLGMIRIKDVRRERLRRLLTDTDYGHRETTAEGFPWGHDLHVPSRFVEFFCASHKGCTPYTMITRIEFEHV